MFSEFLQHALPPRENGIPRWAKWLAIGLLTIHTAWIVVHLNLVAAEKINPWKLGGYGMYTVPSPFPETVVLVKDKASGDWAQLTRDQFQSRAFDRESFNHVFRCRPPREAALKAFIRENPHLDGWKIALGISERRFERYPIKYERTINVKVEMKRVSPTRVAYGSVACGTFSEGEFDMPASG